MEGIIEIAVVFLLPIVIFIMLYGELYFCNERNRGKKLIMTNIALLLYLLGILTPISNVIAVASVYLIFVFIKILNKKDCKDYYCR